MDVMRKNILILYSGLCKIKGYGSNFNSYVVNVEPKLSNWKSLRIEPPFVYHVRTMVKSPIKEINDGQ